MSGNCSWTNNYWFDRTLIGSISFFKSNKTQFSCLPIFSCERLIFLLDFFWTSLMIRPTAKISPVDKNAIIKGKKNQCLCVSENCLRIFALFWNNFESGEYWTVWQTNFYINIKMIRKGYAFVIIGIQQKFLKRWVERPKKMNDVISSKHFIKTFYSKISFFCFFCWIETITIWETLFIITYLYFGSSLCFLLQN